LSSDLGLNHCASKKGVSLIRVLLDKVANAVGVFVVRISIHESCTILRNCKSMHSLLSGDNLGEVILIVLISISKLFIIGVDAVHNLVVEFTAINVFVHGPEAINILEIVEVHPEDTIIFFTIKTDLFS